MLLRCPRWLICGLVGKFYELYERDAYIANKEFQWKITERVNMSVRVWRQPLGLCTLRCLASPSLSC